MPIKRVETGSQIPLSAVLKEEVDHAAIAVAADETANGGMLAPRLWRRAEARQAAARRQRRLRRVHPAP